LSRLEELVGLLVRRGVKAPEAFEKVRLAAETIGCRAYLFGSRAEGRAVPASDIDILVVCRSLPPTMLERGRVKAELLERASIPYYEDVHIELITERDMWYYRPPAAKREGVLAE